LILRSSYTSACCLAGEMGAIVTAPLSAAGTCLGGCAGSCLAAGCCKLASSGSVSSEQAVRCVLVWLQVFTATLATLAAATPMQWLPWTCDKLHAVGMSGVGVCECKGGSNEAKCWSDGLVYRAEAAGFIVFIALFAMAVSGCGHGASRSYAVAKFMAVFVIGLIFLFIQNSVFDAFGAFATSASAVFLVMQAVLLIEFAYSWNELWYGNALMARRREVGQRGYRLWLGGVIGASAILFITSISFSVYFFTAFPSTAGRTINIVAMILALSLLLVSITDICEHGALLTSCVVMAYTVWLICETLAAMPNDQGPTLPSWLGLSICAVSLAASTHGVGFGGSPSGTMHQTGGAREAALVERGDAPSVDLGQATVAPSTPPEEQQQEGVTRSKIKDFVVHCMVHAAAALYVTSLLAPRAGEVTFALHATSLFVALVLYGWSLIAPKILTGRNFNS